MEIVVPVLIVLATSLVIVARSRLIAAISVGANYALVGVLLWAGVGYPIALAYFITGLSCGAIIWLSPASKREPSREPDRNSAGAAGVLENEAVSTGSPPLGWFFMVTTLGLCAIVAYGLSSTYPLFGVRPVGEWGSYVSYWLLIAGLLATCITRSTVRSGLGLLVLLCGSSVSYILISESFRFVNVMGILLFGILLSLAINQLASRRQEGLPPDARME